MECPPCSHPKAHKHSKMPNGHQRYLCPTCRQTFSENFDGLYYRRHVGGDTHDQGGIDAPIDVKSCVLRMDRTLTHRRTVARNTIETIPLACRELFEQGLPCCYPYLDG